jgi:hypothetical protein
MSILDIMKYFYPFSLIIILSLGSCVTNKNSTPSNVPPISITEDIEEDRSTPQIIFMNFELSKQEDGRIKADLINTIITEGKIKGSKYTGKEMRIGDLVCKGLDKNNNVIQNLSYNNPMLKTIEYVNDEGQLGKKQISLDKVQFTVRMQLNPNTKSIALEQVAQKNSISLITFEIE